MVTDLKRFGLSNNHPELIDALFNVEHAVEQIQFDKQRVAKQTKLTSFFS